ncbi:MAG: sel1 repeat family protein, partial [Firmicutes bacterium]|nr:sel1 repeat family protein [Bacillota bacterium]
EWYEKAVAQGHAGAMNNLANLYYHADGVHLDRDKAKSLWQKAADLGDEKAKDNLKKLF